MDGRQRVEWRIPQRVLVRADAQCKSVAAASIVAKVARDGMMERLEGRFPGYGFARHKGYGTAEHLHALRRLGYSTVHRLSFAAVRAALAQTAPPAVAQPALSPAAGVRG